MLCHKIISKFPSLLRLAHNNNAINVSKKTLNCSFTTSQILQKADDRKAMIRSMPVKDEGIGKLPLEVDLTKTEKVKFPDENTPNLIINGMRFADIPICHIKVTKNNTIISVNDSTGKGIDYRSCGIEGYKNAKKGTNVAAQATAISVGTHAKEKGIKQVRVVIKGLGPGRAASVKGLHMSGVNIVSITDCTRTTSQRPRKVRRV